MSWIHLSDADFITKVQKLEKERDDDNPALGYTIGTNKNPTCWKKVKRWILANINLQSLYTWGIDPDNLELKRDLDSVKGNLKRFVKRKYAKKHNDEFCTDWNPTHEVFKLLICVSPNSPEKDRDGEIEIVDGCHRAVAMLENEIEHVKAYIAELY